MKAIVPIPEGINPEQRAVLDHKESLCLSAGAGSGKTRTLVEKYIQLLIADGRQPSDILAITFTEKAAAEMQMRIRKALQKAIHNELDPQRCGDLEDKLINLSGGWISTIHAFGARVLREHPAEAGVDPAFTPLPEQESQILWESAAMSAILETVGQEPRIGEWTLRMGLTSDHRGGSLLSVMMSVRSQLEAHGLRPENVQGPRRPAEQKLNVAHFSETLKKILTLPAPGSTLSDRIPALKTLERDMSRSGLTAEQVLRFLAKAGWDEDKTRLKPGGALKKTEREIFSELETASKLLAAWATESCESGLIDILLLLLSATWRIAEREKMKRRALDFSDLETRTLKLLESRPSVCDFYRARFKHVLVDEYQDVNAVQARIIRILTDDRPSSLFAVGDPKQSIYRFRGADVEQFQNLWTEMEKQGAAFELKSNYRSHPRLVEAINLFFDRRIFHGQPPVEMVAAKAGAGADDDKSPRIQWLSFVLQDVQATERREIEARLLTMHIHNLLQASRWTADDGHGRPRPLSYGDVALLFRATSSLYLYEEAFRRAKIPYELVKAGTAFRSQEIFDLLNALTVFIYPSDQISWLGFLRSPLAGLSDDGILALSAGGDIRRCFILDTPFPDDLNSKDRAAAERAKKLYLQAAKLERKIRTPLSLLDWTLHESGYPAIVAGLPQSDARRRYIETLRATAAQYGHLRPDPHTAFLEAAWRMVERHERETGQDESEANRVKLMTIHQAKGLEFPVVILPDLLRADPIRSPDFYLDVESGRTTLAARVKLAGVFEKFPSDRWRELKTHAGSNETDEQKRLLYVAMTRAQELLVLPGPAAEESAGRSRTVWGMIFEFLNEETELVERIDMHAPPASGLSRRPDPLEERLRAAEIEKMEMPEILPARHIRKATSFKAETLVQQRSAPRGKKQRIRPAPLSYASTLGTLIHDVLEHIDLHSDAIRQAKQMNAMLDSRLSWIFVPPALIEKLKKDLAHFFQSPLIEHLRSLRERVKREYPFTFIFKSTGAQEIVVNGKVDLLILGDDTVEIYDYKYKEAKGHFGEDEGQLMAYALAACRQFDLPHVTAGLQFLTGDQPLLKKIIDSREAETYLSKFL